MKAQIPTEKDWGNYQADLDIRDAHSIFSGRANEEMIREYAKDISMRATDLRFMPAVPFQYYMLGFSKFVKENKLDDFQRGEAASCFFRIIEYKLACEPADIIPIMDDLLPLVAEIAESQSHYNLQEEICGNFKEKEFRILTMLKEAKSLLENNKPEV